MGSPSLVPRRAWVAVGAGVLLLALFKVDERAREAPSPEEQRALDAAAVAKAIAADSVKFTAFFAAPDTTAVAMVLEADDWADRTKSSVRATPAYAMVHSRAVRVRLDSAAAFLDGDSVTSEARQAGRIQLAWITAPLSANDSTRKAALDRRWQQLDDRATVAYRAKEAERARALAVQMVDQRKTFARALETQYLDQGLNVTVTTRGQAATTLHLKWILVDRVMAHQVSKSDLVPRLREMGFKRFEISDGYDESWYWTL